MLWIIFAILASVLYAISNVIDKYILTKYVKEALAPVAISCIIGLAASFLVFSFQGFQSLSFFNILLSIIAGVAGVLTLVFYFKAVKIEEVSRVVPLFYLTPLFVLLMATVFLAETFTPIKYFGIFLLVVGAIFISAKNFRKLRLEKALVFMLLADISISIELIIMKYLLGFADFWTIFSYLRIGAIVALIPIFYFSFHHLRSIAKTHGKKAIGIIALSETLTTIGILFTTVATSLQSVALVDALSSVQPFFVLLFAVCLSVFVPRILKEEIGKQTVFTKLIAIVLLFIGTILIT